ncbi:MAG: DUF4157 domain-containing protein [Acidobacteria bacterium]|nr:DUF4157 domain-containing protein [Acidobacteriota bacterium]
MIYQTVRFAKHAHKPASDVVLQRARSSCDKNNPIQEGTVPPIVYEVLHSSGQQLSGEIRGLYEPRFRFDFSNVRVHADSKAMESALDAGALAYTVGRHIVFGAGQYRPNTTTGRKLIAHELMHVVQQSNASPAQQTAESSGTLVSCSDPAYESQADDAARQLSCGTNVGGRQLRFCSNVLQKKAEKLGTRLPKLKGLKRIYKKIKAEFDGKDFAMHGDGTELVRAAGQSGRSYTVKRSDAESCGGSPDDSYMNNARYVGVADNGPIPEGEYAFKSTDMVTFSYAEQRRMQLAAESEYVDPSGLPLHGDWGAARAPLRPINMVPARHCGNTRRRSGFYLHGGIMPGSSGCIDIGNAAITGVAIAIIGYPDPVHLKVKYTQPPPEVGFFSRAAGRFMYPPVKDPSFMDRLKSLLGGGNQ